MKVIYIAGSYRDKRGEWFVRQNIRKAEEYALAIWKLGAVALCPHKNTAGFGGAIDSDENVWLVGDLELISRCDALLIVPGWEDSEGTKVEIEFAREHGMPIFFQIETMKKWLKARSIESVIVNRQ